MGKLHELLPVEKDIRGTFAKITQEINKLFSSKVSHFEEMDKQYVPLKSDDPEMLDREFKPLVTTVPQEIEFFMGHVVRVLDVIIQKEASNAEAKADVIIVLDNANIEIAKAVPVSALVQMENILETIKAQVFNNIPTLEPQKRWDLDTNRKHVYVSDEIKRLRCKKVAIPVTLHPGTERHAPQVQLVNEDLPVGNWIQTDRSGKITSAEKSDLLSRLDYLMFAVKSARARANDQEIKKVNIGKRMITYVMTGN
ncbi:MAG TPA: hypothetical protein VMW95_01685 [Desulfobacterales bacterium]|nr:hypothetical protein [Desulfobacterales bacterium]